MKQSGLAAEARPAWGTDPPFRKIFNHSNDAIFVIDLDREAILDANPRAAEMLEYSREELLRTPIHAIHPDDMPAVLRFSRSVIEKGSGWTNELTCVTKSGQRLATEMSASVVEGGSRSLLLGFVRDVTERKRLQRLLEEHATNLEALVQERTAQLRQSEERLKVLLRVNNAIVSQLERAPLFEAITQILGTVLDFDRASITLASESQGALTVYALAGVPPSYEVLPVGAEIQRQTGAVADALRDGRPVRISDLRTEPPGRPEHQLAEAGFRSALVAPLLTKRRTVGTVNVASRTLDRYSDRDAELLAGVAQQAALAVENMLAFEEIRRLQSRLEQENLYLQEEVKSGRGLDEMLGHSPAIRKVRRAIETVAATDASVLITGETGTGKELVARAVHRSSKRRDKPMVAVNCSALPAELIESELFGHEKGAFTGAAAQKVGRFEFADGGTLFLDEIGELRVDLQAKLLRVLQQGEFERVGGSHTLKVDVRVISASNRDLEKAIETGLFRADLFYRLNVFPIFIPPLRNRKEDVPILVRQLVLSHAARLGKRVEAIPEAVMAALVSYPWPGNVRELENVIERAVILTAGPRLDIGEWLLRPAVTEAAEPIPTLLEAERKHIVQALEAKRWRVSGERGAARLLGLKPTTLEARMKKLGIWKPS